MEGTWRKRARVRGRARARGATGAQVGATSPADSAAAHLAAAEACCAAVVDFEKIIHIQAMSCVLLHVERIGVVMWLDLERVGVKKDVVKDVVDLRAQLQERTFASTPPGSLEQLGCQLRLGLGLGLGLQFI